MAYQTASHIHEQVRRQRCQRSCTHWQRRCRWRQRAAATLCRSGDDIVAEVCAKADALLAQLPDSYQQPLLSRESLSEAQVSICLDTMELLADCWDHNFRGFLL
jgi:hypothetical protein